MSDTELCRRSSCPIACALDILGDKWTLLVLRDMVFSRKRHFNELLDNSEGIASNILAERLKRLTAAGIVTRSTDQGNKRRRIYTLTDTGLDLIPVLVDLVLWGGTHQETGAPEPILRRIREDRDGYIAEIRANHRPQRSA